MAEIKWIKFATDMFNNAKIMHIRALPEGNNIVLFWVMLLAKAGKCNMNGYIFLTETIPYTSEMLAKEFDFDLNIVKLALATLNKLNMVELINNIISIQNWDKYQNVDGMDKIREQTRKRVAKHRECQSLLSNDTGNVTVTQGNATEEDKEEDIYIAHFATFWEAYPKKKDKKKAQQTFNKLKVDHVLLHAILSALETQRKSKQWQDQQYIPYPSTWLNGRRWEDTDEVTTDKTKAKCYGGIKRL